MSDIDSVPTDQSSYLVADCGKSVTTVALFDAVDGMCRLVARAAAPTTVGAPWSNIIVGIQQAIKQISEVTGRILLSEHGELIMPARTTGAGVDHFGATISAAPALRTVIAGLLQDVSVASARHALHTIYADEIHTFSLADNLNEQERINALLEAKPELILLTGGTDGGDKGRLRELAETIEVGINLLNGSQKTHVVFAGNRAMREEVTKLLEKSAAFQVADNVRPTLETEQLATTIDILGDLYQSLKIENLPGVDDVHAWSPYPLLPTARAFSGIIDYFAALYEGNVVGLDLGSDSLSYAISGPQQQRLLVRTDLGVGAPLPNLLDEVEPGEIVEWMPVEITSSQVYSFIQDKALHPYTVPMTEKELYLEQTLARLLLRTVHNEALVSWHWPALPPLKMLLVRGTTLVNAPRPGQTVLTVLDALQPTGIFSVAIDKYGVLPALGWLALHEPLATVQALEGGALVDLGWVIAPAGQAEPDKLALKIVVDSERKGNLELDVTSGELEVLPLAPGEEAQLTLKPARNFDIGFGPGRGKKVTVYGGDVGLIIDARGRPLQLPQDETARRSLLRQWHWDMGG